MSHHKIFTKNNLKSTTVEFDIPKFIKDLIEDICINGSTLDFSDNDDDFYVKFKKYSNFVVCDESGRSLQSSNNTFNFNVLNGLCVADATHKCYHDIFEFQRMVNVKAGEYFPWANYVTFSIEVQDDGEYDDESTELIISLNVYDKRKSEMKFPAIYIYDSAQNHQNQSIKDFSILQKIKSTLFRDAKNK